jgi:hypothetical protein
MATAVARSPRPPTLRIMSIRDLGQHGHPVIRGGVVVAAVVLIFLVIMTAVSVVVGLLWVLIKIGIFVLLIAGLVHIWRRSQAAGRR